MSEPMTASRLADIKAKVERAHAEIFDVAELGPVNRWRMSIPANSDRDTDLIVSDALDGTEDLLAEVGRLQQGMRDLYARWIQRAHDNGDYYNRMGAKYELGKGAAFDAAAEEIRLLIGKESS